MKKILFVVAALAVYLTACAYYGDQFKYDPCVDRCVKSHGKTASVMVTDSGKCVCIGQPQGEKR